MIAKIEQVRDLIEYEDFATKKAKQEIEDHKSGKRESISRTAAGVYLGVHKDTISRIRSTDAGNNMGSKSPTKQGSNANNQRVTYTIEELEAYKAKTRGKSSQQQTLQQKIEEAERTLARLEAENRLAKLNVLIAKEGKKSARIMSFDTLADCIAPHDWVLHDGKVVGHVLSVSDEVLEQALDEDAIETMSLERVMNEKWGNAAQRKVFTDAFSNVIGTARENAVAMAQSDFERIALTDAVGDLANEKPSRPKRKGVM